MKYELYPQDDLTERVNIKYGDILVLHTDDGGKVIVYACMSSDSRTCSKCRLSDNAGEYPCINCSMYNFICPLSSPMYFLSIAKALEDL